MTSRVAAANARCMPHFCSVQFALALPESSHLTPSLFHSPYVVSTPPIATEAMALLNLPNELLLEIAQRVEQCGILALALTCREMRPIAQEVLMRTAVVSSMNIWKLADTLESRPELAKALTHLRLGAMDQDTHDAMQLYSRQRHRALRADDYTSFSVLSTKPILVINLERSPTLLHSVWQFCWTMRQT